MIFNNVKRFVMCYIAYCGLIIIWATWIIPMCSATPLSPVICDADGFNCVVTSTYGVWPDRSTCPAAKVAYPSTEPELISVIADAVKNSMKIKVVSRWAHSSPKLVCAGGHRGLIISTRDYATKLTVNVSSSTATVHSGVELKDFVEAIAKLGFTLPNSPYWDGLSIGGLLSTGAHGSSLWGKGGAVHEYVVGMRLIVPGSADEGYARIMELTEKDEDLKAAKVSLGVLGVISHVTFALQPMFKRSITNVFTTDEGLEDTIASFGWENEFGDVTWYASKGKVVLRVDNRVPLNTSGDGVNAFIGFQKTSRAALEAQRAKETRYELMKDSKGKCKMASKQIAALIKVGMGFKNKPHAAFSGYPIIGYQNALQTSGDCQYAIDTTPLTQVCPWDHRFDGSFLHQTTVSVPISRIQEFVADVKKLRDLNRASLCGVDLNNGLLMRYVKQSSAYLGKTQDMVDVDFNYYRASNASNARLHEDVFEEIEQLAVFKYQGLPHWGKNRNVAFLHLPSKYSNLRKFLEVKQRYDPQGLLSSEWTDAILGISPRGVAIPRPHCALEGLCICSEDVHCAPDQGYFCRRGRIFESARVCRFDPTSS